MHCGYIIKVEKLRPHPNADKLQVLTCFGLDVCVGLDIKVGDLGVYFPTDLQLSVEFCEANTLMRKNDENGKNIGGYMDPDKRNVTSIKLRGEKSDGLFLPLSCLTYTGVNMDTLNVGDIITVVNGHPICQKYIPAVKHRGDATPRKAGNKVRHKKAPVAPLFQEHADTEQLAYNLAAFKPGDMVEITLKMHGTSQRTGHLPVLTGYKRTFWDKLFKRQGTPVYEYGYVTGTRRTVCGDSFEGGYYGSNEFREQHAKKFEGKLWKGETVYYEVVGYTDQNGTIMGVVDNRKTKDKEFIKAYGETTTFSYGCAPGESECYVYRMTMTNTDGEVVEYTPDFMRYRCEQMGVNAVPVFATFILDAASVDMDTRTPGEMVKDCAECFYDGADPIGKTHVREGVVCRIVNRPKFTAYKHKGFNFKVIEGIAKVDADAPDIEEAQEVNE